MSMTIAMNDGNNAVAPQQANVTVPMPDAQPKADKMDVDFTFTVESMTAAAKSDGMDITKVHDDYLRVDGPDKQPGAHTSSMPPGGSN